MKFDDIKLHIGCGEQKQAGWVGIDFHKAPGIEIVHDLTRFPYPLKDRSCHIVLLSFVLERIPPSSVISFFNELWRILKPGGQALIATYYAGSHKSYEDPTTYRAGFLPESFQFFDPQYASYLTYKPLPWRLVNCQFDLSSVVNVVMETMRRPDGKPVVIKPKKEKEKSCQTKKQA